MDRQGNEGTWPSASSRVHSYRFPRPRGRRSRAANKGFEAALIALNRLDFRVENRV